MEVTLVAHNWRVEGRAQRSGGRPAAVPQVEVVLLAEVLDDESELDDDEEADDESDELDPESELVELGVVDEPLGMVDEVPPRVSVL